MALASIALVPNLPQIAWNPPLGNTPGGKICAEKGSLYTVARTDSEGKACFYFYRSEDLGKSWSKLGLVASDEDPRTDLGDGNVTFDRLGHLFAAYRQNHRSNVDRNARDYSIRVATSQDQGKSWQRLPAVEHVEVAEKGPSRGLWAPFVFVTEQGRLQCYFDDEHTPFTKGFPGHQWLDMRSYDPTTDAWSELTTVSRAHDPKDLSRDGMGSVVQLGRNRLACSLESVSTHPPIVGTTRIVFSNDEGKSWSWAKNERQILYAPKDPRHHAFCPWIASPKPGLLACVFGTEEDSPQPAVTGSPANQLHLDIKLVWSRDGGKSWSSPEAVYRGTDRNYLPSVAFVSQGKECHIVVQLLDFEKGWQSVEGVVSGL